MGPLVPFILSEEFGLVIALIIGIAFGFILEQAGFSSTKKLVGLFYGYDFTVLRVFFTAGVTAMIGVLLLAHYGLLDISVIYINPTFLRSAIIGGLIMGAGFVIGGFCPGTSICAAAIGKIDAFAFIFGSLIGIFIFTVGYPVLEDFYLADAMGDVTIFSMMGMSKELFALLMLVVAVVAFYATWMIENKVNKRPNNIDPERKKQYIIAFGSLFLLLAVVSLLPGKNEIINHRIAEAERQKKCVFKEISADKLAYEITNNYYKLNVIDVRPKEEFEKYHLPMAINIPFEEIMNREWEYIFKQRIRSNVFYANSDTLVRMSCLKAKYIGKSDNFILRENADEFRNMFFNLKEPVATASKEEHEIYHYRNQSAIQMNNLMESLQNIGKPVKKEIKKVKGGCS